MALTPEEVINKRFQPTKFKEGYNPEEVDDFLDEIVIELRRLNAENASLKRQLEEAEAKIALAPSSSSSAAAAPAPVAAAPVAKEPVAPAPTAAAAPAPVAEPAGASSPSATGLLAMAQKVHDDYVFEGKRERERLITEGREEANALLTSAQEQSSRVLGDLEKTKSELEVSVAKLRTFEHQYRTSLRDYLTSQLTTLDEAPILEPKADVAPASSKSANQRPGGVFGN